MDRAEALANALLAIQTNGQKAFAITRSGAGLSGLDWAVDENGNLTVTDDQFGAITVNPQSIDFIRGEDIPQEQPPAQ